MNTIYFIYEFNLRRGQILLTFETVVLPLFFPAVCFFDSILYYVFIILIIA